MMSLPDFREKQIIFLSSDDQQKVSFRNTNVVVRDADNNIIHQSSCYRLFCLIIIGNTVITSGLIERARKFAFSIVLMKQNMRVYEVLNAETSGNFLLREKQYTATCGNELARKIVHNKILNQRSLLMNIRGKTDEERIAIERISDYLQQATQADDRQMLLGLEGKSAQEYFQTFFSNMNWDSRKPRIKHDIPNLLLDIGYTYLFNLIECFLRLYGFDVYKGVYHTLFFQRKSLVCDLVEPFRCIIDQALKRAYGLKQVDAKDFELHQRRYVLPFKHNKKYTRIFLEALMKHKTDIFLYVQSYDRNFMRQNPVEHYPVFEIAKAAKKR